MAKKIIKGRFITFEGSEGCGKSTQSRLLARYLRKMGFKVLYLREPGGTKISEKIREILLDRRNQTMVAECEMLLYMAARAQVVAEIIEPALRKGMIVICDRFLDSTLAYQGFGLGMDIKQIRYIGDFVTKGLKPDLTIFMDLPIKEGLARCGYAKDRIESRSYEYHRRVRNGYLALAKREPERIKIIRLDDKISETQKKIRKLIDNYVIQRY